MDRTFIWADGDKYVGEYKNEQEWPRNLYLGQWRKYVGEYKNNEQEWPGNLYYGPMEINIRRI